MDNSWCISVAVILWQYKFLETIYSDMISIAGCAGTVVYIQAEWGIILLKLFCI